MVGFIYVLDETRIVVFDLTPVDSTPLGSFPIDAGLSLAADEFSVAVGGSDDGGFKVTQYVAFGGGAASGSLLSTLQGPKTLLSYPVPLLYEGQENLLYVLNSDFTTESSYVTVYPRSAEGDQAPLLMIPTSAAEPLFLMRPSPSLQLPVRWPGGRPALHPRLPGDDLDVPARRHGSGAADHPGDGDRARRGESRRPWRASIDSSLASSVSPSTPTTYKCGWIRHHHAVDANLGGDVPPTRVIPSGNQDPLFPPEPLDFDVDDLGNIYVLQDARPGFPTPHPGSLYTLNVYPPSASGPAPQPSLTISGPNAGFSIPVRVAVVSFSPE